MELSLDAVKSLTLRLGKAWSATHFIKRLASLTLPALTFMLFGLIHFAISEASTISGLFISLLEILSGKTCASLI
jgi:hypothetical protein